MHGEGDHQLAPSLLLKIQRMTRTGSDPELHPAKLSPMMKNTVTIGIRVKVRRTRALGTGP